MQNTLMKKSFMILFVAVLSLGFSSAWALTLNQAKAQGLVGEMANGYVGVVKGSSPQLLNLVRSVNSKRTALYKQIAKKNGTSLMSVQKIAGTTAIKKTARNHYIKTGSGWSLKR